MSSVVLPKKKSAFACTPCRKRKSKCDGGQPVCKACMAHGDAYKCEYEQAPSLKYTHTLERKVLRLEQYVEKLRLADDEERARLLKRPNPTHVKEEQGGEEEEDEAGQLASEQFANELSGLSVDAEGGIRYHGPTSLYATPEFTKARTTTSTPDSTSSPYNSDARTQLVRNAWEQRNLEPLGASALSREAGLSSEIVQYLLDCHWSWIQPLFNFVYRPAFTRDMSTQGAYFSPVLFYTILAHSARFWHMDDTNKHIYNPDLGPLLFSRARMYLDREYLSSSIFQVSIPNVQALLLISARQVSHGNPREAWIYSGLAFRMLEELGIHLDGTRFVHVGFSEEDVEIRRRLFWSCYFWDKVISLYLGRVPTLRESQASPPRILRMSLYLCN